MDTIVYTDSNKKQDYATHPMFRYFGKLPPTLVSRLMDEYCKPTDTLLELMCGSGTTLVESYLRGIKCVGVDINPLSVMISRAKTTKIDTYQLNAVCDLLKSFFLHTPPEAYTYFRPKTRNLDYWFTESAQSKLSAIKYFIEHESLWAISGQGSPAIKNLLFVTYAGIIRKISNASPRTGRIFHCAQASPFDAFDEMIAKFQSNITLIDRLPESNYAYNVVHADARKTGLPSTSFDFILNHPPYFALYKYSSDVLRFELEWMGFDRSIIAKGEIEDGFKTTNERLLDKYVDDMKAVFTEMHRLMKDGALSCVVVSDSKLRETQLPVVDRLICAAADANLSLAKHMLRPVSFAQASYHKSANPNIRTTEDHVLLFTKRASIQ